MKHDLGQVVWRCRRMHKLTSTGGIKVVAALAFRVLWQTAHLSKVEKIQFLAVAIFHSWDKVTSFDMFSVKVIFNLNIVFKIDQTWISLKFSSFLLFLKVSSDRSRSADVSNFKIQEIFPTVPPPWKLHKQSPVEPTGWRKLLIRQFPHTCTPLHFATNLTSVEKFPPSFQWKPWISTCLRIWGETHFLRLQSEDWVPIYEVSLWGFQFVTWVSVWPRSDLREDRLYYQEASLLLLFN